MIHRYPLVRDYICIFFLKECIKCFYCQAALNTSIVLHYPCFEVRCGRNLWEVLEKMFLIYN